MDGSYLTIQIVSRHRNPENPKRQEKLRLSRTGLTWGEEPPSSSSAFVLIIQKFEVMDYTEEETRKPIHSFATAALTWSLHYRSLYFCIQLFFQLSDLGLQASDGGFVLWLDCWLQILQLEIQLLVLSLRLTASSLQLLRVAALWSQLRVQLITLKTQETEDKAQPRAGQNIKHSARWAWLKAV